jgi:hypothetical protein
MKNYLENKKQEKIMVLNFFFYNATINYVLYFQS